MNCKIPPDAFTFYWSLGPDRSYKAVAKKYDVSVRAVHKLASREKWQKQIEEIEKKGREAMNKKMAESVEEMCDRHIKCCKLIQRKALEALKSIPVNTAMDAIRALDISIKQERLIRGEPTDRSALNVEDVIKKEYDRWLVPEKDQPQETVADGEALKSAIDESE